MWLVSPLVLACAGLPGTIAAARAHGVREVGLNAADLDASTAETIRSAGLRLHGWAARTGEAAATMLSHGVTSFTTDRPDVALEVRGGGIAGLSHEASKPLAQAG